MGPCLVTWLELTGINLTWNQTHAVAASSADWRTPTRFSRSGNAHTSIQATRNPHSHKILFSVCPTSMTAEFLWSSDPRYHQNEIKILFNWYFQFDFNLNYLIKIIKKIKKLWERKRNCTHQSIKIHGCRFEKLNNVWIFIFISNLCNFCMIN